MKLHLRAKLIGISVLAGGLCLLTAILVLWTLGYRHSVTEQGTRFENEAAHVAGTLGMLIGKDVGHLDDLLALGGVSTSLANPAPSSPEATRALDARWSALSADSAEVSAMTRNPLAARLRTFQQTNRFFAEILVADRDGRLAAATNKTSDYDQSDESWWRQAMQLHPGEAVLEGLAVDQSSGIFSLDIAMPIVAPDGGRPVGVLKAVVNIAPLFAAVPVFASESKVQGEIVRPDGTVVMRLDDASFQPGSGRMIPAATMKYLQPEKPGWFIRPLTTDGPSMVGHAPVHLLGIRTADGDISGPPFYMLVHVPAPIVLAPLRHRTLVLTVAGFAAILLCVFAGVIVIQRNVLRPIETLRRAASAVAATAARAPLNGQTSSAENTRPALRDVAAIKTGDEMEELARDFSVMAERLLDYQTDLRREIAQKTEEIQRDLDLARDFQQAFLPRVYPHVRSGGTGGELTLNFHHIYQAAATVSGDFFDVVKLDEGCVGILIADVMGHGTRSALVTAILRTILHGLGSHANNPAHFLSLLNRHFFDTMKKADQLVFVSVCYVVIDTRTKVISCASAGHPSPLIGNRLSGAVTQLYDSLKNNPALGLFPDADYRVFTRSLHEQDVLLLFTDGIIEAMNDRDEDFGRERLEQTMRDHLDADAAGLTRSIIQSVMKFTDQHPPSDDVCLVTVEALPVRPPAPDHLIPLRKAAWEE